MAAIPPMVPVEQVFGALVQLLNELTALAKDVRVALEEDRGKK